MNILLWILQVLLAILFGFAGVTKLALPIEVLESMGSPNAVKLPAMFLKFIGLVETLGAFGLVFPGVFRRRPELTPLAAAGLIIVMIGALVVTIMGDGVGRGHSTFCSGTSLRVRCVRTVDNTTTSVN